TTLHPFNAALTAARSVIEALDTSTADPIRLRPPPRGMDRTNTTGRRAYSFTSCSTRRPPMKPVPPVTTMRFPRSPAAIGATTALMGVCEDLPTYVRAGAGPPDEL